MCIGSPGSEGFFGAAWSNSPLLKSSVSAVFDSMALSKCPQRIDNCSCCHTCLFSDWDIIGSATHWVQALRPSTACTEHAWQCWLVTFCLRSPRGSWPILTIWRCVVCNILLAGTWHDIDSFLNFSHYAPVSASNFYNQMWNEAHTALASAWCRGGIRFFYQCYCLLCRRTLILISMLVLSGSKTLAIWNCGRP